MRYLLLVFLICWIASGVVRNFYDGINSWDLSRVVDLIAEDCVYEDLVFPKPIVGRKAILEFFEKFIYTIIQDLQFVIDDISGEDTSAIGVTWHLDKSKSLALPWEGDLAIRLDVRANVDVGCMGHEMEFILLTDGMLTFSILSPMQYSLIYLAESRVSSCRDVICARG
ncbi:polyketide cyclase SnoaL-like domain-containing protein [Tanacetum coccineum]